MSVSYKKSKMDRATYYVNCMSVSTVGSGDDAADYYAKNSFDSAKEPPGIWYCGLNSSNNRDNSIGIIDGAIFNSLVDVDDIKKFKSITQGFNPVNGAPLVQNAGRKDRLAFHDFCLSAPKSVSVLFSQSNDLIKQKIEDANTNASRTFLDFMSSKSYSRQGKDGVRKTAAPLMASLFPHASSRQNDPQLHCHAVVFNVCQRPDGTTGSLETLGMMKWMGAASSLYHADLAWDLRKMEFGVKREGNLFEIDGVPDNVKIEFSQRRAQIVAAVGKQMTEMGLNPSSAKASRGLLQKATIETRNAKNELGRDELETIWHERGAALGFTHVQVESLMCEGQPVELSEDQLLEEARAAVRDLTETNAIFKEQELLTKVAVQLVGRASSAQIIQATEMVKKELLVTMSSERVNGKKSAYILGEEEQIFTTQEMLTLETEIISMLKASQDKSHILENAQFPGLQGEQLLAAIAVTQGGLVSIVEGTAGSGKTFTMKSIKNAYEFEGYNVTGLSSSWSAALNLANETNINGRAITGWVNEVNRGQIELNNKTLIIVDEAGMSGSKQINSVLDLVTSAGGKLILLGDTLQQSSVSAGDPLRLAVNTIGSSRLDVIRRQKCLEDRISVKNFFNGDADTGLKNYQEKGSVHIEIGDAETNAKLVEDWNKSYSKSIGDSIDFHRDGVNYKGLIDKIEDKYLLVKSEAGEEFRIGNSHLIISLTKEDSKKLNRLAHESLKKSGKLGDSEFFRNFECEKVDEIIELSVGDKVVFKVNNYEKKVYNKNEGVISSIKGNIINILHEDGRMIDMDTTSKEWEHQDGGLGLSHSYATTAYSSQGLTIDRVYVKGANYNREQAGVSMSRHRESVEVYVDKQSLYEQKMARLMTDEWKPISSFSDKDAISQLSSAWSRETDKKSSVDFSKWRKFDGEIVNEAFELENSHAPLITESFLLDEARLAVQEITETHAIFNENLLTKTITSRLSKTSTPEEIIKSIEMIKVELLVANGSDKVTGYSVRDLNQSFYTTKEMLLLESEIISMLKASKNDSHIIENPVFDKSLKDEQLAAAISVTKGGLVSIIEGGAGTGKTYLMSQVKNVFIKAGYQVTGLSSGWSQALNLADEAKINGLAITGWISSVMHGTTVLNNRSLIILDEAGQTGSKQTEMVLKLVTEAGGKLIMLGDSLQQSSVSAGDPLRLAIKEIGSNRINFIRRQNNESDRQSVHNFFSGKSKEALSHYISKNLIHVGIADSVNQKLIQDWHKCFSKKVGDSISYHRDGVNHNAVIESIADEKFSVKTAKGLIHSVGNSNLILALTRNESNLLNKMAHDARKADGGLGDSSYFSTFECKNSNDKIEFSVGDLIVFRKSVLDPRIFNKETGIIESINGDILCIRTKDNIIVSMDTLDQKWEHEDGRLALSYGYSTTIYSSQGMTVDNVFLKNASINREQAGVAMSRHRESVQVYVDKQPIYEEKMSKVPESMWVPISDFSDQETLTRMSYSWNRKPEKISSVDFSNWKTSDGSLYQTKLEIQIKNLAAARALAAEEISRIQNITKNPHLEKIPTRQELPFQRLSGYVLKDPVTDHKTLTNAVDKLTARGIDPDVLLAANKNGFLKFDKDGTPLFCGRRPQDNALVNIKQDGQASAKSLREGYPPILAGNTGRVDLVESGHDALALWSSQAPDKRSTIIVVNENEALKMPHTRKLIEQAESVHKLAPGLSERLAERHVQSELSTANSEGINPESKSQVADAQAAQREAQRAAAQAAAEEVARAEAARGMSV